MTIKTNMKAAVGFIIISIIVAFVFLNREETEVNLIVTSIKMSRAVLVLMIFVLGFLVGWLLRSVVSVKMPFKSND